MKDLGNLIVGEEAKASHPSLATAAPLGLMIGDAAKESQCNYPGFRRFKVQELDPDEEQEDNEPITDIDDWLSSIMVNAKLSGSASQSGWHSKVASNRHLSSTSPPAKSSPPGLDIPGSSLNGESNHHSGSELAKAAGLGSFWQSLGIQEVKLWDSK